MRKLTLTILLLVFTLVLSGTPQAIRAAAPRAPQPSTAAELIQEVNALRTSRGLPPYQTHPILMAIAQGHAEYMASISMSNVHIDAQGRRPFQRAIEAGYMVAGDLSQGGWFSENVTGGINKTPQMAVQEWMGDPPHQGTMLSATLRDVGAGVAIVGNTYYYCLDAGLSTGGTPVPYTPPPPLIPYTPTIATSTPNPDGLVVHIVQPGDTLGSISVAYDVSLAEILALNKLTIDSIIYPGQEIIVQAGNTPTPTLPTSTPTIRPSSTPWPTSTATPPLPSPTPTPPGSPGIPVSAAGGALAVIIASALLVAGLLALSGRKRK